MKSHPLDDPLVVQPRRVRGRPPRPVWSSPTPPRRSPSRVRSWPVGPGAVAPRRTGELHPPRHRRGRQPSSTPSTRHRDQRRRQGPPDPVGGRDILAKVTKVMPKIPQFDESGTPGPRGRRYTSLADRGQGSPSAEGAATSSSRRKFGAPTITNDGVSIAREVELEDVFRGTWAPSW